MAKSSHLPKNASVFNPLIGKHCELFWQTTNCDHILENYYSKEPKIEIQKDKSAKMHDVKFRDFDSLLSGNTHWKHE